MVRPDREDAAGPCDAHTGCEHCRPWPLLVSSTWGWGPEDTDPLAVPTAYWRFWLCVSVVYELFLIFILFQVSRGSHLGRRTGVVPEPLARRGLQEGPWRSETAWAGVGGILGPAHGGAALQTVQDGRQFLKYVDPRLGVPLPERDYGGNCLIYDPGNETDPFHNIWVRLLWAGGGAAVSGLCLSRAPVAYRTSSMALFLPTSSAGT